MLNRSFFFNSLIYETNFVLGKHCSRTFRKRKNAICIETRTSDYILGVNNNLYHPCQRKIVNTPMCTAVLGVYSQVGRKGRHMIERTFDDDGTMGR